MFMEETINAPELVELSSCTSDNSQQPLSQHDCAAQDDHTNATLLPRGSTSTRIAAPLATCLSTLFSGGSVEARPLAPLEIEMLVADDHQPWPC